MTEFGSPTDTITGTSFWSTPRFTEGAMAFYMACTGIHWAHLHTLSPPPNPFSMRNVIRITQSSHLGRRPPWLAPLQAPYQGVNFFEHLLPGGPSVKLQEKTQGRCLWSARGQGRHPPPHLSPCLPPTLAPKPPFSGPGPVTHLGLSHPTSSHPKLNSSSRGKSLLDIHVVTTEVNRTKISVKDRSENNLK